MSIENERRWLVKELPENWQQYPHKYITQGYLEIAENGDEKRVRRQGNKYYYAEKAGPGQIRNELRAEITEKQFQNRWPLTKGKKIYKIRYEIGYGKHTVELNIFTDTSMHGRMLRRLMRDIERTKMSYPEILRMFLQIVEPMHRMHIEPTKRNADIIIKNEYTAQKEAARMKKWKHEGKYRATVSKELLSGINAELISGMEYQSDYYYCSPDQDLKSTGEIVRIRKALGKYIWTAKGPNDHGVDIGKKNPVMEFQIKEKDIRLFEDIYGECVEILTKFRTKYLWGGIKFSVDKHVSKYVGGIVVNFGNFIEIQLNKDGSIPKRLNQLFSKLGLDIDIEKDMISDSYFEM